MATVNQITSIIKNFAPESAAMIHENDNVGLLLGDDNAKVSSVVVALDASLAVLKEAIDLKAELIVCHHPFIYGSIKRVNASDLLGQKILLAAQNGINIYAAHTNLDFVAGGINDFLASSLGLRGVLPLDPYIDKTQGFGRVGELANKVSAVEFKNQISLFLKDNNVRMVASSGATVRKIAIINGGGGGDTKYIDIAKDMGADCLVTADVKHHVAVYASELGLTLIEPDHYTMEHIYLSRLVQMLKIEAKASNLGIEVFQSKQDINPKNS